MTHVVMIHVDVVNLVRHSLSSSRMPSSVRGIEDHIHSPIGITLGAKCCIAPGVTRHKKRHAIIERKTLFSGAIGFGLPMYLCTD